MATRYWEGTTGAWSTAANWSADTVPATGDTVIFDGRVTQSVTSGVDQTGVDLAKLHVMPSYTGSIGDNDTGGTGNGPLIIEVSNGSSAYALVEGTGDIYLQVGNDANDAFIDELIINKSSGTIGLSSQKNAAAGNVGRISKLIAIKGTINVYGTADIANTGAEAGTWVYAYYIQPTNGRDSNVTLVVGDDCHDIKNTAYCYMYVMAGNIDIYNRTYTIRQSGGTITNGGTAYSIDADNDYVNVLYLSGGTFNWHPSNVDTGAEVKAAPAPAFVLAHLYGGTFDASDMLETQTTVPTISTLNMFPGSTVKLNNDYGNIAVTTLNKYGGEIETDARQSITLG